MRQRQHRTLPIPQVDPPSEYHADNEPGVEPLTYPPRPSKQMTRKYAFRTPVFPRAQSGAGLSYGMNHEGRSNLAPGIPLPVRSSLAQEIALWRVQLSFYFRSIARATRFPGMAPGYPTAKVLSLINTTPRNMSKNGRPARGLRGYPARSGYMNAPPRFTKAIPVPVNDYQAPVYGE